jgi:hypothetical protein
MVDRTFYVLEVYKTLVQFRIQCHQVVEVALFAQPLCKEEPCKCHIHEDTLIERLSQYSPNESVPIQLVGCIKLSDVHKGHW